jgi:cell division protein FtsB
MLRKDSGRNLRAVPLKIHEADNYFIRLVKSQRFLAIIALAFLLLISFPLARTYSRRLVVEKEISDMKSQIAEFQKNNQEMQEFLGYLATPASVEEQARLNYNLKKPGEGVVVIEKPELASGQTVAGTSQASSSNFAKWWRYFF